VEDAIQSMRQLDGDVQGLRADVESEVGYTVERINGLLTRIHELNDTIARLDGLGRSSGGPVGQRLTALEELSTLTKVIVRDQPDGRVTIETASGSMLLDKRLRQLNYPTPGTGVAQPIYPVIEIRFADGSGALGASTGERIDSAAVGGKLGGLIDLRDRALPRFSEQLGTLFGGLAETLNAVANAGTTMPAPARLDGRSTGLTGADRLGFSGQAVFAVVQANGTLIAKTTVDFDALGPTATVDDAVAAINAGLGGAATASFTGGRLSIQASAAGNGIAIAQDEAAPSDRAGIGFSQYFGLNDLVRSVDSPLVPSGFMAGDPHGFRRGPDDRADPAGFRRPGADALHPHAGRGRNVRRPGDPA
jgi:flagellar hook-associated protein 1 FlgK